MENRGQQIPSLRNEPGSGSRELSASEGQGSWRPPSDTMRIGPRSADLLLKVKCTIAADVFPDTKLTLVIVRGYLIERVGAANGHVVRSEAPGSGPGLRPRCEATSHARRGPSANLRCTP
jgi:hypothetical protein